MSFSFDKFLRPLTPTDRNIKIYEDNGILKYTINPFHIKNTSILNNTMRMNLDSDRSISMVFSTNNEAKISLSRLQSQIDELIQKVPFTIDKDILNYVTANIKIGPTGSNGTSGLSKIYTGTSSTYLEIPVVGSLVELNTQPGLGFVPGQTIVVYRDFPMNYYVADDYYEDSDPVYMVGDIDTYDYQTGQLAFVANFCQTPGLTSSIWYINLTGQRGQDGTSGTSGTSGSAGMSAFEVWIAEGSPGYGGVLGDETYGDFLVAIRGPQGPQGFEGLAGSSGSSGTSGTSGIDGFSAFDIWISDGSPGYGGVLGDETYGDFLLAIRGPQGPQGFEGLPGEQGPKGETGSAYGIGNGLLLIGNTVSVGGTLYETLGMNGANNDLIATGFDNISMTSSVFDVVSEFISLDADDTQILAINDITISAGGQLALTGDSALVSIGNTQGLVYQSDYSTGFVDNSLVSKKYVDDSILIGTSGTSGVNGTSGTSGTSGISGLDGAASLRWTLENYSNVEPSGSGSFSAGSNIHLVNTNSFKFAYNSLSVASEGFWDTIGSVILNGSIAYIQVTQIDDANVTALYKVLSKDYGDPESNGGRYSVGVELPPVYANGSWTTGKEYVVSFSILGKDGTSGVNGAVGPQGQSSNLFYYKGSTSSNSGNPGTGYITWSNIGQTGSTYLNVNHIEEDGTDIDVFLALIIEGQEIIIQDRDASGSYQKWTVSGAPTFYLGLYWAIPVTYLDSGGTGTSNFADQEPLFLGIFNASGTSGTSGVNGTSGTSGVNGTSGTTGTSGISGTSGITPTTDWTLSGSLTVSGTSSLSGHTILSEISETINVTPGATASTVVYDFSTGAIWYHSTATTNYTANFTNMPIDNNRVITATIMISQGATPYIPTAVQIGGTASAIKWAGGTASGTANKLDIVGFTFVRTGSAWAQVLGQINYFG